MPRISEISKSESFQGHFSMKSIVAGDLSSNQQNKYVNHLSEKLFSFKSSPSSLTCMEKKVYE